MKSLLKLPRKYWASSKLAGKADLEPLSNKWFIESIPNPALLMGVWAPVVARGERTVESKAEPSVLGVDSIPLPHWGRNSLSKLPISELNPLLSAA